MTDDCFWPLKFNCRIYDCDQPSILHAEGIWRVRLSTGSNTINDRPEGTELGLVVCGDRSESKVYPLIDFSATAASKDSKECTVRHKNLRSFICVCFAVVKSSCYLFDHRESCMSHPVVIRFSSDLLQQCCV